jgi:branched-chain amino acid transport system substrate-binding protein
MEKVMKSRDLVSVALSLAWIGSASPAAAQISGDVVRIGFLTDMSGVFTDADGPIGAEAVRLAIADMGGMINGKKIELVTADHGNKSDLAAAKAREWFDQQGVDMLIGGGASGATLAMAKIAEEKKRVFIAVGTASPRLTNEECSPYTVHYAYDTVALARGTGSAVVKNGGKSWFFLTADYTFGASLEKDTSEVVTANGGKVLGSVRHPLNTSDFSSFILQAQSSKAEILGLANGGADTVNAIKAANEFGLTKNMKMAGLLLFITDVHNLGLELTKGMYVTEGWYWDQDDESRAWAKRLSALVKKQPTVSQAGDYSAAMTYFHAVQELGSDDPDRVMAQMKKTRINDMFTKDGVIRPDGRMVYDMKLMQIKTPEESKYPWDYYKIVQTIPGSVAYTTKEESKCALWK